MSDGFGALCCWLVDAAPFLVRGILWHSVLLPCAMCASLGSNAWEGGRISDI